MHLLDIATAQPCLQNNGCVFRSKKFIYKKVLFGDERRLPYTWKSFCVRRNAKNLNFGRIEVARGGLIIRAVATFEYTQVAKSHEEQSEYQNLRMDNDSSNSTSTTTEQTYSSEDSAEVDVREKLRRLRISKANKGNTPWNKGKKHSAETRQRIRERTKIAMQDPKVKMKLVNLGHAQSEETRIKIGLGVRMGWEKRREKLMLQETCYYEWQNLIAEASRNGLLGEEELQWDSYKILDKQLEQEWLQSVEERKKMRRPKGSKRAPKSPEQRKKISEAIAAKWADPGYRTRVTSALAKYHGIPEGAERKPRRKPSGNGEPRKGRTPKKKVNDADEFEKFEKKTLRVKVKKSKAPRFKDPLASSKLEMLKSIRAQRASSENKKSEAIARAKVLIAEAEKAAKALESAAEKSPIAYASLIETRKLIAEAVESIERAELDSNEVENSSHLTSSDPFEEFNAEMESLNETDHKTVNGKHVFPTSMNSIDDIDLEEFALHSMLNGSSYHIHTPNGKENLSLRSTSDYDLSPEELNDLVKHSGQLHDPELDGSEQNIQSLLANEARADPEVVESPKSINVIKKWVRGRLVEVVEEDKSS